MKVFLDDTREAPEGWARTRTAPETVRLLQAGGVTHLSLDHDLGDEPGVGTGSDVLAFVEEQAALGQLAPPEHIYVLSSNAGAAPRMMQAIESIRRLALPSRFFQLVGASHGASEAVDFNDLHSGNAPSEAAFAELQREQARAARALIEFARKHGDVVLSLLEGGRR